MYNTLEEMLITQSVAEQTLKREPSSSQPLGSMNEYNNVVDDVKVNLEDGKDLHSEDTPVRDGLQA